MSQRFYCIVVVVVAVLVYLVFRIVTVVVAAVVAVVVIGSVACRGRAGAKLRPRFREDEEKTPPLTRRRTETMLAKALLKGIETSSRGDVCVCGLVLKNLTPES